MPHLFTLSLRVLEPARSAQIPHGRECVRACVRVCVCVCARVHSLGAGGAWQTQHLWVRETCILLGAGSSPPYVLNTGALGSGGDLQPRAPAVGVGASLDGA